MPCLTSAQCVLAPQEIEFRRNLADVRKKKPLDEESTSIQCAYRVPTRSGTAKLAHVLQKNAYLPPYDSEVLMDGRDKTPQGGSHPGKDS